MLQQLFPSEYQTHCYLSLLILELSILSGHVLVLTRIWRPLNADIIKNRLYFLIDLLSALLPTLFLPKNHFIYYILVFLHFIGHLFYLITWKSGYYAKRIQFWSSREYLGPIFTFDFILTVFDVSVHSMNCFLLCFELMKSGVVALK